MAAPPIPPPHVIPNGAQRKNVIPNEVRNLEPHKPTPMAAPPAHPERSRKERQKEKHPRWEGVRFP